jgi:hypothetical protein
MVSRAFLARHEQPCTLTTYSSPGTEATGEPSPLVGTSSTVRAIIQPERARETLDATGTKVALLALAFTQTALPAGALIVTNGERYRVVRTILRAGLYRSELVAP